MHIVVTHADFTEEESSITIYRCTLSGGMCEPLCVQAGAVSGGAICNIASESNIYFLRLGIAVTCGSLVPGSCHAA